MMENQMGRKVKVLRFNNGGEYTFKEFKDYLASKGIKYQLSIPRQPEQNGVAEGMNRTLTERACSIRLQADMSEIFWAEAVNHANSLVDSQKKNKLESKSKKYIFIGFTKKVKSFRLWDPEKKSAFTSRDVILDKKSMLQEKLDGG